jgi:glycosyltransferase involved in cell wall biosynthesis
MSAATTTTHRIPKILHQLWIGDQTRRPTNLLETWKQLHPDWEYILWTEEEIEKRGVTFECSRQIADIHEINGKADIMRWEILYKYGGIFQDADSVCLEPLDPDIFLTKNGGFSCYEQEQNRKGLVCCGSMGFPSGNPLLRDIITHIGTLDLRPTVCNLKAWVTVACVVITNLLNTGRYPDFTVFPSHMFIPHHFSGPKYQGHKKVYAYQVWGSTHQSYHTLNNLQIPADLLPPPRERWVSVLISSYNTPEPYIRECLESIRSQIGHIGIQVVWVDDGSDAEHKAALARQLDHFEKNARFCKVTRHVLDANAGVAVALCAGVNLCENEIIVKMDSDDIMKYNRIERQIEFMERTPDCVICGANLQFFKDAGAGAGAGAKGKVFTTTTNHPAVITWADYKRNPLQWFMNHPTIAMKKTALLAAGGYNTNLTKTPVEDFEMELRMLRKYGKVYNLGDVLLNYRLHAGQVTHTMNAEPGKWAELRQGIIKTYTAANP